MTDTELKEHITKLRTTHPDLIVIIYGPTATGKSGLSLRLADLFAKEKQGVEIISADSRQVYKKMDIGTDKISVEDRTIIPHYGIDLIEPNENYTAHQRQQDTKNRLSDILSHGNIPMIVGGTGLYIDTIYKNFSLPPEVKADRSRREELELLEKATPGYLWNFLNTFDPDTARRFDKENTRYLIRAIEIYEQTGIPKSILAQEYPVDHPILMISLVRDRDVTKELIHKRVEEMIQKGLVAEVEGLLDALYSPELQSMNGIGYRQTVEWLQSEEKNKNKLIDSISLASVQYAKRQRTRFRRYKKDSLENPKENVFYMEIEL